MEYEQLPACLIRRGRPLDSDKKVRGKSIKIYAVNGVDGKECTSQYHDKNDRWVPLTEFYFSEKLNRFFPSCKACACKEAEERKNLNWYTGRIRNTIYNAKRRGIYCVEPAELDKIIRHRWQEQAGRDFYTNEPMEIGRKPNGENADIFSIDRVDRLQGYVFENIVLCKKSTNSLKGSLEVFSTQVSKPELLKITKKIIDTIYKNA